MIINNQTRLLVLGIAMTILSGCAITAAGGAAAGATASIDRRTAGAIIEDQTIELKAYAAIQQDGKLDEQTHISVTSYNGRVLITGEAPLAEMKQKITDLVSDINKVSQVYNEVSIAAPSSMVSRTSDTYITTKVKARMIADEKLSGLIIKTVTEKGVVYLLGIVSRDEAELATTIARETGGVQKVVKLFEYLN